MTITEDPQGRRGTGGTLTVLAVTAIRSPLVRRVTRTRFGREIRSTAMAERAMQTLSERYRIEMLTREVVRTHRARRRGASGSASFAEGTTHQPVGRAGVTRFVILGQGRTGSNLVQTELNRRWPEMRCLGEEYGADRRRRAPSETIDEITARVFAPTEDHPIVGCKLFYLHLYPSQLRDIITLPGMKVVHLRRRNLLRRYVSLQIAINNDRWLGHRRMSSPTIDERAVTINVDHFLQDTHRSVDSERRAEEVVVDAGVDVLDVWYEDLSEHLDAELRRIAAFLGAGTPVLESEPLLRRQNPEPLRLLVRNYEELRGRLSPTAMRVFLDPEDAGRRKRSARQRTQSQTCWPSESQELLLQAALRPPDEAGDAFVQWRNVSNPYEIDEGSRRLLPMVYRNFRRAGLKTSLDALLWDAYVQASARNQMLLRTLERVLAGLHDAGLPTLVLKGAALTVLHYRDRGTRPMADLDVMVPLELAGDALDSLRAAGWDLEPQWREQPLEQLLRMRHAVSMRLGDDELDLHWYALAACIGTDLEAGLWDSSVEMDVGGQRTRALAPADQLLQAFAHGLRHNPVPTVRWIADAHVVITSSGDALDWDQLLRRAARHRLSPWVSAAVTYLDGKFPSLVPPAPVAAARSVPVTARERREFEHSIRHSFHWILDAWHRYRRREADRGVVRAAAGFAEELRVHYDLDHAWQVPERALRGIQQQWRGPERDGR